MQVDDYPNEYNLRYHVHVLCVHAEAVLKFAAEIADEGPDNLTEDDKKIYDVLADYLERGSYTAEKLKKRVRRK
jgi:hypothetical protein